MRGDDDGNGEGVGGAGDRYFSGDGWGGFHFSSGDGFCAQESIWDDYVWIRPLPPLQRVWVVSGDGRPAFVFTSGDGPGAWS